MERLSELFVERYIEEDAHRFIIYFLDDDEDQNVHVDEVEEIDFPKVTQHLAFGGSVFITHRRKVTHTEEKIIDRSIEMSLGGGKTEDSTSPRKHSRRFRPLDHFGG